MLHIHGGSQIGMLCACLEASLSPSLLMGSLTLSQPRPAGSSFHYKKAPHKNAPGQRGDPKQEQTGSSNLQGILQSDIPDEVIEEGKDPGSLAAPTIGHC